MVRNILIPTDFTARSLAIIPKVMSLRSDHKLNILLFHVLYVRFNAHELLFMNRYLGGRKLVSKEFVEACEVLEQRFQSLKVSINTRIAYGSTLPYIKNIIQAEEISEIFMHDDIILSLPSENSVHMEPLLKKTGVPVTYISDVEIKSVYKTLETLTANTYKQKK